MSFCRGEGMRNKLTVAVGLLAIALVGVGCSHAPNDNQIATNIKAHMYADAQLKGTALDISVKDGVATVSGQVPSVSARYEAFRLAAQTTGVKKVNDQMTVEEAAMTTPPATNTPLPAPAPEPAAATEHRPARPHYAARQAEPAPEEPSPEPPADSIPPGTLPGYPVSSPAPQPAPAAAPAPVVSPPPAVERLTVPQGTLVSIRMIDSVDSGQNHIGDIFHAELANPIAVKKQLVAPKGADVYVRLVQAHSAGHFAGQSELRLELYRIVIGGKSYALVSNDYDVKGAKRGKRSALAILGGAAVGAAIGAIAGGGKGAAIGAATGGGGGAVYQGVTHGQQVSIPSETLVNFQLAQPVTVTVHPSAAHANP
jgi:hypothetical protein